MSVRQLFRRDFFIARLGSSDDPDVIRVFEIEITGAVRTIDRAIDDAHVAFAFRTRSRARARAWLRWLCILRISCICLRELFCCGAVVEKDHLAVGRPLRRACATRERRKLERLATRHCKHEQLWRLDAPAHLRRTNERQILSSW